MVDAMDEYTISSILLEEVDSTNDWARANLLQFSSDITLVRALCQSRGRGISGGWFSPREVGIYSSYVTSLLPRAESRLITYVAIASILETLEETGLPVQVKWPNDIMLNNKKMGGVLSEVVSSDEKTVTIIGIGLNINTPQSDIIKIDQPATSLYIETDSPYSVEEISNRLTYYIRKNYARFVQEGFSPFYEFLQSRWLYLGQWIQITTSNGSVFGKMVGIGLDGALQLELASKERVSIYSGRIVTGSRIKPKDRE